MRTEFSYCCVTLGYENGAVEWDEYPQYLNAEGLEIGSPVGITFVVLIKSLSIFL